MKKKLILSAAIVAVMGAASLTALTSNSQTRELSDLELANIEALTDDETENPAATCRLAAGYDDKKVPCHYCLVDGTGPGCTPCGDKVY